MKLARVKLDRYEEEDLKRIEQVLASYGVLISRSDIALAWEEYSVSKDSQWIKPQEKDEDIYLSIIEYLDVEDW